MEKWPYLSNITLQEIWHQVLHLQEPNSAKERTNQSTKDKSSREGLPPGLLQVWGESDVELGGDDVESVQDCGLVLDTGVRGKECWPIRNHTLCYRSRSLSTDYFCAHSLVMFDLKISPTIITGASDADRVRVKWKVTEIIKCRTWICLKILKLDTFCQLVKVEENG